jgi:dynein heavy chain 2
MSQLPDTDAPFMFGLPDNIERSVQRSSSAVVIRQLRALSLVDATAMKFDREKWRAQVSFGFSARVLLHISFLFLHAF